MITGLRSEGWSYGVWREDSNKQHPDLVPYNQPPESEREYDCEVVTEVLKVIVALGYVVRKALHVYDSLAEFNYGLQLIGGGPETGFRVPEADFWVARIDALLPSGGKITSYECTAFETA
jgi:hypothetical protein